MKSPRSLSDLPFAAELLDFAGTGAGLEIDGDYDRVRFDGITFTDMDAGGARFTESAFLGGALEGTRLRRARLSDVYLEQTRLVATDIAEAVLTDVWLSGCVLAGVQAFALAGRRMTVTGCKLDSVNFRDCALRDVTFTDCVLRDVDFGGARLTRIRFPGCTLSRADFTKASCTDVDLRGARLGDGAAAGIKAGFGSLRGVRIDTLQLMTLAPLLAHHLGITVEDG